VDFLTLSEKAGRNPDYQDFPILCFDPGHTTGWAFFEERKLVQSGEIDTTSIPNCVENASNLFNQFMPSVVVMEDYRIYRRRQKQHVGSAMLTTRVIGCLETLAVQQVNEMPEIVKQPAHVAKGFCTDKKLKEWDMYDTGLKHARDAVRHGCYFIMFGAIRAQDKSGGVTVG
jgi:hypothetical protein